MDKPSPPSSPLPLPPLPTTFVQADPTSFKQTVQLLTGSAETAAASSRASSSSSSHVTTKNPIPPLSRPKKPSFKLYERRPSLKNLNMISPFSPAADVIRSPPPVSPSVLDFPSLTLSPVTPLTSDPLFDRSPSNLGSAEERGILEKGFYLHPSPRSAEPPRLLPLFPLSSPRGSSA